MSFNQWAKKQSIFDGIEPRIREQFFIFHDANPHIFKLFEKYAAELKQTGRRHYGANIIIERIRWHQAVSTTDQEFKINNNHAPMYARLLILVDPSYRAFFRLRKCITTETPAPKPKRARKPRIAKSVQQELFHVDARG